MCLTFVSAIPGQVQSDTSPRKETCINLQNFTITIPMFHKRKISKDLWLTRIDDDKKSHLWNNSIKSFPYISQFSFHQQRFKVTTTTYPANEKQLINFITACRLYKRGNIGFSEILTINLLGYNISGSNAIFDFSVMPSSGKSFILSTNSEFKGILKIYRLLEKVQSDNNYELIRLGIRRLNLSYSRIHLEDRLIDLVIALESVILFGTNEELRYRLSLRGAYLLSRYYPPLYLETLLKKTYDIRSKLVHDGLAFNTAFSKLAQNFKAQYSLSKPIDFVLLIEDITRTVLLTMLKMMENGKSLKIIIEQLDKNILLRSKKTGELTPLNK